MPQVIEYVRQAERDAYVLDAGEWAGAGHSTEEGRGREDRDTNVGLLDAL